MKKRNDTINFWRKKSYQDQKTCFICKKECDTYDNKKYFEVRDHCYDTGKYNFVYNNNDLWL